MGVETIAIHARRTCIVLVHNDNLMLHNFARVSCKALFNLQEQEYYQLTVLSAVLTVLLGLKTQGQADSTIHDYEFYE